MSQTRILIADPSVLVAQVISQMLAGESDLQVVATAQSLDQAELQFKEVKPDVILLAAEMQPQDNKASIAFAQTLMQQHQLPIILMSSLSAHDAHATLDALERGVFSFVERPHDPTDLQTQEVLKAKLRAATRARIATPVPAKKNTRPLYYRVKREGLPLIAIGASTGGVSAIEQVLKRFSSICPPVVVAQHLPAAFVRPFAARLNQRSQMTVVEAAQGAPLQNGYVYVAPANKQLTIRKLAGKYVCELDDILEVSGQRASIDTLFKSVAATLGHDAIGVLLTGMGEDGAEGLRAMRERGAHTIAQDEASSLVYSMPHAAMAANAASAQLALKDIPRRVIDICNNKEVA